MAEVLSTSMADTADGIVTLTQHHKIAAVPANCGCQNQPTEAIRCNIEVLEKLMFQLPRYTPDSSCFCQPH